MNISRVKGGGKSESDTEGVKGEKRKGIHPSK